MVPLSFHASQVFQVTEGACSRFLLPSPRLPAREQRLGVSDVYRVLVSCRTRTFHLVLMGLFQQTGFPGGSDSKESACNAGDTGSIPGLERYGREGNGNPLQYSFAWRIPWTEEPGGLQSVGGQMSQT